MNVVLIYNDTSGGSYGLRKIKALCRARGITISYSFTIKQLTSKKLASLIQRGVVVMAVGGDGTINSAARLVVGTKSTLLPLPGGTLNHFVRDLGMPSSIEEALDNVEKMQETMIDVGYVNDELFLNTSSLGLYPFALLERKDTSKRTWKWFVAFRASFNQLVAFKRISLIVDGKKLRSPFVFIGNNEYDIKESLIPARSSLTKRTLTVMIATSRSRIHLMRAVLDVARGKVAHRNDLSLSRRQELTIYTHDPSHPVSFDGEVKRLKSPFHYRVQPASLRVLCPKQPI